MRMTKESIALVIQLPGSAEADEAYPVLIVQRPDDDEDLPGAWGLPAGSLRPGESPEDAAARAGLEKLGVHLRIGGTLREGRTSRGGYTLHMRLLAAAIEEGAPHVPQGVPDVTQYQAWRWGSAEDVVPAAERGSLCSRLYLEWLRGPRRAEGG